MLSSFAAFFSRVFSDEEEENKEPNVAKFVYRDNLNKKPSTKKGKVRFASSVKPQLSDGKNLEGLRSHASSSSVEDKGVIRVKVKMTKAEAARLLSKCNDGGIIGFKDVANELVQIPMNRVDVICPSITGRGSILKTIPE